MPIRALKIAVIVMGVMIVAGTGILVTLIVHRAAAPMLARGPAAAQALVLQEPAGTRIAGIAATQDRLAVQLQGGGPDRVVLIDPHSGAQAGEVRLAHEPAGAIPRQ